MLFWMFFNFFSKCCQFVFVQLVRFFIINNNNRTQNNSRCPSSLYTIRPSHLLVSIVNSARPSSGCRGCFPLSAATTSGLRPGVALPPASPLSRVCPRRRGGSPSGDLSAHPALSLRGCGPKALDQPPSVAGCGKVTSRPWQFQWVTKANLHISCC